MLWNTWHQLQIIWSRGPETWDHPHFGLWMLMAAVVFQSRRRRTAAVYPVRTRVRVWMGATPSSATALRGSRADGVSWVGLRGPSPHLHMHTGWAQGMWAGFSGKANRLYRRSFCWWENAHNIGFFREVEFCLKRLTSSVTQRFQAYPTWHEARRTIHACKCFALPDEKTFHDLTRFRALSSSFRLSTVTRLWAKC